MTAMDIKSYLREIEGLTTGTELRKKKRAYDDECRRGLYEIDNVVAGTVVKRSEGEFFGNAPIGFSRFDSAQQRL